MPHTVTEDLARQPTVTVKKITPASVREFLRRSNSVSPQGDLGRVVDFFGGGGGGGGNNGGGRGAASATGGGSGGQQRSGAGPAPPPDTELLLELLEFCLSDCRPPEGERPSGEPAGRAGVEAEAGAAAAAAGGQEELDAEAVARSEAHAARFVSFGERD